MMHPRVQGSGLRVTGVKVEYILTVYLLLKSKDSIPLYMIHV